MTALKLKQQTSHEEIKNRFYNILTMTPYLWSRYHIRKNLLLHTGGSAVSGGNISDWKYQCREAKQWQETGICEGDKIKGSGKFELYMLKGNSKSKKHPADIKHLTAWKATEDCELFCFICGREADNSKNALADCSVQLGSLQGCDGASVWPS